MAHHVVELVLWLLLAFIAGAIVGCLIRRAFATGGAALSGARITGPALHEGYAGEGVMAARAAVAREKAARAEEAARKRREEEAGAGRAAEEKAPGKAAEAEEEAEKKKVSNLSEMQDLIAAIEGKLMQLKSKMPKSVYDMYTVVRGDYLWKISKKPDIYGDPYQWMKIYTYNRDMIKNPDLIYPDWSLKIPRKVGPNEYVVTKGDFLRKIAETQLGDPTQWVKIYEANKSVVKNKNLIYPYEILVLPKQ